MPGNSFDWVQSVQSEDVPTNDNDKGTIEEQKRMRFAKDTGLRLQLAYWVIITDSIWLVAVLTMLIVNNVYLHLSDSVLIVLLGTTTLNVLGLAFIVLKGMFGGKEM